MKPTRIVAIIASVLVLIGLISLLPKLSATGNLFDGAKNLFEQRNQVECTTTIVNPALADVKIASFKCAKIGTCRPIGNSGIPLSLLGFYDEGVIQWNTKDFTDSKGFSIPEFIPPFSNQGFQTYKTSVCTLDNQVTATVIVDNSKTDSKSVTL